ncbi:ATP-binding cassette domain-containing protein [Epidermidibacterium keratini]|uniref:ATP-binding cassette domain-containing protein n=1 Tax=Epidermidibacterium keratini TaxID=1891644 RepID=A0A7L4YHN3_9ACTN|nr:ATP-binding cassette domain-containing protein [Epidermidibacterium keratini]QHB98847.1 ATP-binding cassette domain-containing protein [Epidermidibacterium keratini]
MEPILTVTDLVKTFTMHAIGGRTVASLRGVSLQLQAGQHVAIAGASGAGKSSLLRCIYRNYLPDSGTVTLSTPTGAIVLTELDDREMARIRGREFGYVSQFLQATPRTGPLELVTASARRRGLDRGDAREAATQALRTLGVDEPLWDVDCNVLSGGERQRVNLAAGTVSPPRLLLLDEPVSALDPANRERALHVIDALAHQNVSVLAVYHDMAIIRRLADRVIVMDDGQIIGEGSATDVLDAHFNALAEV